MQFVRFAHDDGPSYGVVDGQEVAVIEPHPFASYRPTSERVPIEGMRLLAPVIPSKVVCVGRNFADHAAELGDEVPDQALYFLKPSTAVIGPGEDIRLPTDLAGEFSYEAELAVVIGALLQRVSPEAAMAGVLGYTAANDVTARDLQRREKQWFRGKAFDGSCPLGPVIATDVDPSDVRIRSWVDGELRQDGTSEDMIHDVPSVLSEISHYTTLLPGDVVLTGTPPGVGALTPGQTVRVEVEGVGVLENRAVARD
jgi:2-keto-4-pentenoate hydratase/2-oxohepta-3-ene-1,7-dioic acid hydratase in catechol pathway